MQVYPLLEIQLSAKTGYPLESTIRAPVLAPDVLSFHSKNPFLR